MTGGIEAALDQAREAAATKDVVLGGGARLFEGTGPELSSSSSGPSRRPA